MINATLKNAATMSVGGYLNAICSNRIVNKLIIFGFQRIEAFLNDLWGSQQYFQCHLEWIYRGYHSNP